MIPVSSGSDRGGGGGSGSGSGSGSSSSSSNRQQKAQPRPSQVEFMGANSGSRRLWWMVAWHGHLIYPAIQFVNAYTRLPMLHGWGALPGRMRGKNLEQSGWGGLPGRMHTRQTRGWGVLLGLLLASLPCWGVLLGLLLASLLTQVAGEYSSASYLHRYLLSRLGSTPRPICCYYLLSRLWSTPRPPTCITT